MIGLKLEHLINVRMVLTPFFVGLWIYSLFLVGEDYKTCYSFFSCIFSIYFMTMCFDDIIYDRPKWLIYSLGICWILTQYRLFCLFLYPESIPSLSMFETLF
jgi:hypothetical protein